MKLKLKREPTVYQRIDEAFKAGRGVRLTLDECEMLALYDKGFKAQAERDFLEETGYDDREIADLMSVTTVGP